MKTILKGLKELFRILFIGFIFLLMNKSCDIICKKWDNRNKKEVIINDSTKISEYNVYKFIDFLQIKYPEVVMMQFRLANSTSYLKTNNILNITKPTKRPNLVQNGDIISYKSWEYCLIDYSIYQNQCLNKYNYSETDYIKFLARNFYKDDNYFVKINSMLNEYRKGD